MKDLNPSFAIRGDIVYAERPDALTCLLGGVLVCEAGKVAGVFQELPERYAALPLADHSGKVIAPGLVDLHLHAPQYAFRGLRMDLELLDWLEANTFPQEAKYADLEYAERAYHMFADAMKNGATTRAGVFATCHVPATLLLMDLLDDTGLACHVGKVNMDRNSPADLCEKSSEASLAATREWLAACEGRYRSTKPILTPRFIPSCTDGLMLGLAELQRERGLPVQSHLSENLGEIAWVRELCPTASGYADAYRQMGLFGGEGCPTIMAHCVHPTDDEVALLRERQVFVAHCPASNANLSSGIAPVRRYLNEGIPVGLGTDIAGGFSASIFRMMSDAIQHSKLRRRLLKEDLPALTLPEAFYLGTKGGGAFFGKVGSFEPGYEFDALVLDDADLPSPNELTLAERLERLVYLSADGNVREKYVAGVKVKG